LLVAALAVPLIGGAVALPSAGAQPSAPTGPTAEFTVLADGEQNTEAAEAAVRAAGGTVVHTNPAVGLITANAPADGFVQRVSAEGAVYGAAKATAIGHAPAGRVAPKRSDVEKESRQAPHRGGNGGNNHGGTGTDPLDDQLWGLKSVRSDLARTVQPGDKRVKVGVIDTGVDGTHPDIAPNFDRALSRNFTRDIPTDPNGAVVDGPCEFRGCVDPADHDDNGHGTHVAGTIAAAADGFGISGVAPNVSIVNLRAGQDSRVLLPRLRRGRAHLRG